MSKGGRWPVLGVGLGLFIASTITLFYRSAPLVFELGIESVKPFATGMAVGVLLVGACLCLYHARDKAGEGEGVARLRAWAGLACGAIGVAAFVLQADAQVAVGIVQLDGAGVLVGVGAGLQLSAWQRRFLGMAPEKLFLTMGCSLVCAGAVCGIVALLPFAGAMAFSGAAALAATAGSVWPARDACMMAEPLDEPAGAPTPGSVLSRVWKPAAGAVICMFVIGYTWDTDQLGVALNGGFMLASERVIAFALGAVLLFVLGRSRLHDIESVLLYVVLPLALVTFIVRPYFLSSDLPAAALALFGVTRETGFALFFSAAWYELCTAPRKTGASAGLLFGAACVLCGVALLLGFCSADAFGPALSMMGAVLFIVYLVGIVAEIALRAYSGHDVRGGETAVAAPADSAAPGDSSERPTPTAQDVEAFLNARAEAIGEEYGLTAREREILLYLGRGHSYAAIAERLYISENTVRTHARNIYRKVGVGSKEELVSLFHRSG